MFRYISFSVCLRDGREKERRKDRDRQRERKLIVFSVHKCVIVGYHGIVKNFLFTVSNIRSVCF